MDHGGSNPETRQGIPLNRARSLGSSFRRSSFNSSCDQPPLTDHDAESESVSEAGDIGDRALYSNRFSDSERFSLSLDRALENGAIAPIPENPFVQSYGFLGRESATVNTPASLVPPQAEEIVSTLANCPIDHSEDTKQESKRKFSRLLEYVTCLVHLAVFGILGVLTRYGLQKLFGPENANVTNNETILYPDLPSNMVGSFLMGWWGVVFKGDISGISDYLAIGLTTGYLGSLTTFSGWNQKMLDLSVDGRWLFAILGFFIGLFLVAYSIIFGIETAKGFRWIMKRKNITCSWCLKVDSYERDLAAMVGFSLMLILLWSFSGSLLERDFSSEAAELWVGCLVGPVGVWARWFLARLNGRGVGRKGRWKWVPIGTLMANVLAACVMAALATVKKAVKTEKVETVASGVQLGLLGCLSTVSTFIAEFNAMRLSEQPWRAYAYAALTMAISFALGVLIYSIPVWTQGLNE
ncbi:fluoride export protein 2 [Cucurbita moschata]|uniref:Fluoride export protein 2 n=1 Tax=Cucurbita moschata TaxID=3662 RepID=A0A6J1HKS7_CUCMO|nr:fluoride export protein 2 [Cucurbita moschata]XP_022964430.1 fluoride export protein 2 [Cucurbita moschata]XP_022964436.1 fluoride export protein 2 [Cucurbita moschata]XP_022964444.1 fluoride export protein 2 [Cucurbita moschata]